MKTLTLNELIKYYDDVTNQKNKQYANYVRAIDKLCNEQVVDWILDEIQNKSFDLDYVLDKFLTIASNSKLAQKTINNYKTGLKHFAQVVFGFFNADIWMPVSYKIDLYLCQLVAANALFASPDVVTAVKQGNLGTIDNKKYGGNEFASWDYMLHKRDNNLKKGTKIQENPVSGYLNSSSFAIADDNTYANRYIKTAIAESFKRKYGYIPNSFSKFKEYIACHIWDYPRDRRYYASIPNLVLLPAYLAALSDNNQAVKELLRYESKKRFEFVPCGENPPIEPKNYNKIIWRYSFQ